jgi:hypothetical protein
MIEEIHQIYQASFAGHPRISRNPEMLDTWSTRLKKMKKELKVLPKTQANDISEVIQSRMALYQKEAREIRLLQDLNFPSRKFYEFIEWVNLNHQRYQRHFAGQSRNTRDLGLLSELTLDLRMCLENLQELKTGFETELSDDLVQQLDQNLDLAQKRIQLYENESKAIRKVRTEGTLQQRADLLAYLANQNFKIYREHFLGKARRSRRLATLERVSDNLEQVQEYMELIIESGLNQDQLQSNLDVVKSNLKLYHDEQVQITQSQASMGYTDWMDTLKTSIEEISKSYQENFAGKARSSCDPNLLKSICDSLFDLAYQYEPFMTIDLDQRDEVIEIDGNDLKRYKLVLDQIRLYHQEWTWVSQAQVSTEPKEEIH